MAGDKVNVFLMGVDHISMWSLAGWRMARSTIPPSAASVHEKPVQLQLLIHR